jgi:polyprenyldihydroxybenzoate methyltransferase/3-demethylubiquinol 3-O-methyltransferase
MAPLIDFNEVRVPFVCEGLQKVGRIKDAKAPNALEGVKILDIGCGGGILSEALAKLHATVVGIEPVDQVMEAAKFHSRDNKDIASRITYLCETIEEHAMKNSKVYDVIIASEVIEHVENKDSFFRACAIALRSDGSLFFSCPNKTYFSYYINRIWGELILDLIPRFSHKYSWFIHHDDLEEKLSEYGMKKKNLKGVCYMPILRKWFLINSTQSWYIVHFKNEK